MERRRTRKVGRYRLVRRLGAGAMGDVWEAVMQGPHGFEKRVALKLLRTTAAATLAAMVREARLGARLQHPNVVGTLELGFENEIPWVAMELVIGCALEELAGRVAGAALLDVGIQAAAGLHHVHQLFGPERTGRLVHRDVKPSNLLLDRAGVVKVSDLGIAAFAAERGIARAGTPGFMPPEQIDGRPEPRSDVFALGATLVALALGGSPFGVGKEALRAVRIELPEEGLRGVAASTPGLDRVLRRAIHPSPTARFESAAELGAELASLRRHQASGPSLLELLAGARPELEVGTPPPRALGTMTPTAPLPAPAAAFFGREVELARLRGALAVGGVVTVTGLGGAGKTRLVLEALASVGSDFHAGCVFVDLTEATTFEAALAAVAGAVGVQPGDALESRLAKALGARGRALIVLDNLEQLGRAAGRLAMLLAGTATGTVVLGTSRVALRARGERRIALGPLSAGAAVALFRNRAGPRARGEDTSTIEVLVTALDLHPLAIELAAARTRVLSVSEIAERLADRLRVLSAASTDLPARHRSLSASLDGSFDLLEEPVRRAFLDLSVFEGGFRLEAAEAVLPDDPSVPWAVDVLETLVDASLLGIDPDAGRFSMPASVLAWARSRIEPVARDLAEERHARWFAQCGADDALAALHGRGGAQRLSDLAYERENLVAACRRAIGRGDPSTAGRTALAAASVLERRGPIHLAEELLEQALHLGPDRALEARLCVELANVRRRGHRHLDAIAFDERALASFVALGDRWHEATAYTNLGTTRRALGEHEDAARWLTRGLALSRDLGHLRNACTSQVALAYIDVTTGAEDSCRARLTEAVALAAEYGDRRFEATTRYAIGAIALREGRPTEALEHLRPALAAFQEGHDRPWEVITLAGIALSHAQLGDHDLAARSVNTARRHAAAIGADEGYALSVAAHVAELAGRPDDARAVAAEVVELRRATGQRAAYGLALGDQGILDTELGSPDRAQPILEEAGRVHAEVGNLQAHAGMTGFLGVAAYLRGDRPGAVRLLEKGCREAESARDDRWTRRFHAELGRTHAALGDPERARAACDRAERGAPSPALEPRLRLLRAEVEHLCGAPETARRILQEVLDSRTTPVAPDSILGRELARLAALVA